VSIDIDHRLCCEGKPSRVFTSADSIAGIAFSDNGSLLYTDWRNSIYRFNLLFTNDAFFSENGPWLITLGEDKNHTNDLMV
jgi:hypothetical protein